MEKPSIVWMSNSPLVPTGYGVATRNVVFPLRRRGYDIRVVAFWGLEGAAIQVQGVTIYPKRLDLYGRDAAELVIKHVRPDVFITLFDIWVGREWLPKIHPRWVAWTPVDHDPLPEPVYDPLSRCYKPVAMSRFGQEKMIEAGINAWYIPHGVDTKIFKPLDKLACRRKLGFKEDAFIVAINAANKGHRKDFNRMFLAFKKFLDDNPDAARNAKLYVNTWPRFPEGLDLAAMIVFLGLKDHAIVTHEFRRYCGISDQGMAEFYNTADVFLNLARGEGFGLPIIEAQACFPAETKIVARGPLAAWVRHYTGPLVTIRTKRTVLRATASHPFFTDNGWVPAADLSRGYRLLYCSSCFASKGLEKTYSGNVAEIAAIVRSHASAQSRGQNRPHIRAGILAVESLRSSSQDMGTDSISQGNFTERGPSGTHCWPSRWRRDCDDPKIIKKMETSSFHLQFLSSAHGVVAVHVANAWSAMGGTQQQERTLSISNSRSIISSSIPSAPAPHACQTAADGGAHRVDQPSTCPRTERATNPTSSRTCPHGPRAQFETIEAVEIHPVRDLSVYNLTTTSGTYLAEGYLVHNCGVPCIVTDFSSMHELVAGHGWLVPPVTMDMSALLSNQAIANVAEAADAITQAYSSPDLRRKYGNASVEFAQEYDWERSIVPMWEKLLGEISGEMEEGRKIAQAVAVDEALNTRKLNR